MEEQLFSKDEEHHPVPQVDVSGVATRLKLAEERYENLQKRNQLTEKSLLEVENDLNAELRALTERTIELRHQVEEINTKVDTIMGELSGIVRKHEFSVVERYLDLWQPMRFVTREEAKRIVRRLRVE